MYWYDDNSADRNVIVSSRVRLARNFKDYPFEPRLDKTGAAEILEKVKNAFSDRDGYTYTELSAFDENTKYAMVEKHLISPELARKSGNSAIVENIEKGLCIMVLEEDHLRIQSIRGGLDLDGALSACYEADDIIDGCEKIAFDTALGYLTHCPTNLGTGMRASVMMFLPAMTMTGKIKGLSHQLSALGLTVRGVTGEGSAVRGSLYQFSNCVSQGQSEEEIIANLMEAVKKIADIEIKLREELEGRNGDVLRDRIMRSYGTMRYAYIMDSDELYKLYSDVRLGICMGYITDISAAELDRLLISVLPASLSKAADKTLSAGERDRARAARIKEAFRA